MDLLSQLDSILESSTNALISALEDCPSAEPVQPDILSRLEDILSRDVSQMLANAPDPCALVEQMLPQIEAKQAAATLMAGEQAADREFRECSTQITKYTEAAENAVRAYKDADAMQLLQSRESALARQKIFQENLEATHRAAESMKIVYQKLKEDGALLKARSQARMHDIAAVEVICADAKRKARRSSKSTVVFLQRRRLRSKP